LRSRRTRRFRCDAASFKGRPGEKRTCHASSPPCRRASRQRITELGLHPIRRPTWLSDNPSSSNAKARLRRSSRRSALPFSLGIGFTHLNIHYCFIYAVVNNIRLTKKLKNAELIIEVQKKVAALLGNPIPNLQIDEEN
jgi:hypothetical protein